MSLQPDCPVDFVQVNENRIRITAFLVLLSGILFLIIQHWWIPFLLGVDFFLRAIKLGKFSILNTLSGLLVRIFSVQNKLVDQAPKKFAAAVGFVFSVAIAVSSVMQWQTVSILLTIVLLLFASLESLAGFCAGCYVYAFGKKIFKK